jgi:peptidyl-prolyl cis-trans isomerase SurA
MPVKSKRKMKNLLIAIFVFFQIFVCVICTGEENAPQQRKFFDGVAGFVNTYPVTVGDVLVAMEPIKRQLERRIADNTFTQQVQRLWRDTLEGLIDQRLIINTYEKMGAKLPERIVQQKIEDIVRQSFGGDWNKLLAELNREHLSFEQWKTRLREQMIVANMRAMFVERSVVVSPSYLQTKYSSIAEKLSKSEQVKIRMIELHPDQSELGSIQKRIDEIMAKLASGEDFSNVARAYSDGTRAKDGGDWGWIEISDLAPELVTVISALKPNEISKPVRIGNSFFIVKLENRRKEQELPSLSEIKQRVEKEARAELVLKRYQDWITALRAQAYIKVFDIKPVP